MNEAVERNVQVTPSVTPIRPRRFDIHSEKNLFLKYLDTHGYAVVASVASSTEVEHAKDIFWQFLEGSDRGNKDHLYDVHRGDPTTWEARDGWLGSSSTGIISTAGVGQAPFMWYLRLLPGVSRTFGAIWGVDDDDLLCSFDGANVFRPWQFKSEWKTRGGWFHVDQNAYNPGKSGRTCVQGLLTLTKADEHSGGLTVIPKSHNDFIGLCERNAQKMPDLSNLEEGGEELEHSTPNSAAPLLDFVQVGANDEIRSKGGRLVCSEPGDLVVWDSRTVHCNSPALVTFTDASTACDSDDHHTVASVESSQQQWDLIRMAAYICMTPASWASEDALQRRWEAYINNMTTSHWPYHLSGGTRGPWDMPKNDPADMSLCQRRLIGASMEPPEISTEQAKNAEDTLQALKILDLAEAAEGCGDFSDAIKLYKKAYKLDSTLEVPGD
eukprot:CAMPEP_0197238956 /NCGR_PEP_ID=MMETSP1429-20130617/5455_1 /TAXON_ID=49237 /ORGANISM="Chaetoceros  sp., Strain UNC1202" /LENGTH=439 /DNA_ID=CAMNT_0042698247 /DNA_START=3 /DNA_END=1322 /DNA_ORIENTATION=+